MAKNLKQLEESLWEAANKLRANSPLALNQFLEPVLGLIFLKFVDIRFENATKEIQDEREKKNTTRQRPLSKTDYHAKNVLYVPEEAKFNNLLNLPEDVVLGQCLNDAMKAIESANPELSGVLPKSYQLLDNETIIALLKNFNSIPTDIEGDAFGQIYEYFLGKFASIDGKTGGEFFTPTSMVKLIVEVIEPYEGRVYDPACGSGGMFVQSHEFVRRHLENGDKNRSASKLVVYGQEKTEQTVRIAKMNLALHGLSGDIKQGNTFYEDFHDSIGKFDYTMANPPFNVDGINYDRITGDKRYSYGLPKQGDTGTDNGNFLWIQHFLKSLNDKGRAGFVMHNNATDATGKEYEIRSKIVDEDYVDCIITTSSNLFYNVSLPVTLWFFDKTRKKSTRKNHILFIDAEKLYKQVDTAHRVLTDEHIQKIKEKVDEFRMAENFDSFADEKDFCKVVNLDEIKKNGYSLNPKTYISYNKKVSQSEVSSDEFYVELGSKINFYKKSIANELGLNLTFDRGFLFNSLRLLYRTQFKDTLHGTKGVPFREVVEYYIGGTWGEAEQSDTFSNEVFIIRGTDSGAVLRGQMNTVPKRFVKNAQLKSRLCKPNDILIEVSGGGKEQSTGRAAFLSEEFLSFQKIPVVTASFCKLLRINATKLSPLLAFLFIQDLYDTGLITKFEVQSTGIKNFKFEKFLDNQIINIPSQEQQADFDKKALSIITLMQLTGLLDEAILAEYENNGDILKILSLLDN